jgi:hypothetical protein
MISSSNAKLYYHIMETNNVELCQSFEYGGVQSDNALTPGRKVFLEL